MLADAARIENPEESGAIEAIARAMEVLADALDRSAKLADVRLKRVQLLEGSPQSEAIDRVSKALASAERSVSWTHGDPWGAQAITTHGALRREVSALLSSVGVEQ